MWRENPDLIRKYYLFDAKSGVTGGVYLWKEKAHAEKWHGEEFRKKVKELYGAEPESQFFETPIVVDTVAGEVTIPRQSRGLSFMSRSKRLRGRSRGPALGTT
jgi:hypothetical protein